MVTQEERQQFRQRLWDLRTYREQNPGKGYIEWKDSLNVPDIEFESFPIKLASWITPANRILKATNIKPKGFGISSLLDFIGLATDEKEIQQSENPKLERELREYNTRANIGLDDYGKEEIIKAKYQKFQDGGQVTPSYINHWTGKPISTGAVTPVVDLRTGADFTPVGDALAIKDAYDAAKNKDWSGMSWALATLLPFIPSSVYNARKLVKRPIPKVNKDYTEALWKEKLAEAEKHNQAISNTTNEVYRVVERVMEDPAYIKRAEEVQKRFGDDYLTPYADMFAAYNIDPNVLPNVTVLDDNIITAGRMTKTADGKYVYSTNPNMDIPNVTEHELSHYTDLLKTGEYLNAEAGNNMFYQMSKDLNKKIDNNDNYFKNPSEQKAHMNQLREYLFQHGYISNRGEQIDPERMKQILKDIEKIDSMKSVRRAAKQFGSTKTYTKWFNSIPLLGLGVPALINDNKQE